MKELSRVAKDLDPQDEGLGWDASGEGFARSPKTGKEINLRLDWTAVSQALGKGGGADVEDASALLDPEQVHKDFPLHRLDPVQRAFADRVLAWARELVRTVYARDFELFGYSTDVPEDAIGFLDSAEVAQIDRELARSGRAAGAASGESRVPDEDAHAVKVSSAPS